MKIKICGMLHPSNIREVSALNPDYMGFIFYGKSPRYAGNLHPCAVRALPENIRKMGVFVDAFADKVLDTVSKYSLDMVQLHGDEPPAYCRLLAKTCTVVKAVPIVSADDIRRAAEQYGYVADYLLFDTKTPLRGGSGQQFNWSVLESYNGKAPFFLSGGIGADDACRLSALQHPRLHAVDINSRFETASGLKDIARLKRFIEEIRQYTLDHSLNQNKTKPK